MTDEKPAGLWVRFAAHTIDMAIFTAFCAAAVFCFGVFNGFFRWSSGTIGVLFLVLTVKLYAANWIYYFLWHWNGGQTLGKRWLGLMVVGDDDRLLNFRQANLRWLGYHLTYLTLGLGFFAAGFRSEKRALHDSIAGTKVIHVDPRRIWLEFLAVALLGLLPFLMPAVVMSAGLSTLRYYVNSEESGAENVARNSLGALRESIRHYRMDFGRFPDSLTGAAFRGGDGYVVVFPEIRLTRLGHGANSQVVKGPRIIEDSGRWVYDPIKGDLYIDCSHVDSHGTTIYSW